jgi:hypothetical protein
MSLAPFANSPSGRSFPEQPTKTYVTTSTFESKIFTYTTSVNSSGVTVGTLAVNSSATVALCPVNEILHTNGRFLRPETHPNITKPYIGVYSPRTFISGFIDPTDPTFAKYDVNFPAFFDNGIASPISTLGGQGANNRGGLEFRGSQTTLNPNINALDATVGIASISSTSAFVTVNSSQVNASSIIMLTKVSGSFSTGWGPNLVPIPAIPAVTNVTNGSFRITLPSTVLSGDTQIFSWFIAK